MIPRIAAMIVTAGIGAAPVQAQMPCGNRIEIIKMLETRFKEMPHGSGIAANKYLIERFVSASGSWTILSTDAKYPAIACVVFSGEAWEEIVIPRKYGEKPT